MAKWSEILPLDALNLAVELETHTQEERDNGKMLYPLQD